MLHSTSVVEVVVVVVGFLFRKKGLMLMKKYEYKNYDDLPLSLSVEQVAAALGISRTSAYDLVRTDGFPRLEINCRIVVPKMQFIKWIEKQAGGID